MANEAVETAGPSAAQLKKKASAAKWAKISGGLLAAVMILRGVSLFIPKDMPHCADSEIQSSATDVMNSILAKSGSPAIKVTGLTQIQEGPRADKLAKCTAVVTVSDKSKGTISYQIERGKGGDQVRITAIKPT